jgi:hypothetical protein
VAAVPQPPWHRRGTDQGGDREKPRPRDPSSLERGEDRNEKRRRGEEEPFALRQPRSGEQDGGRGEAPRAPIAEPEREHHPADHEQGIDQHVGLRDQQARRDARHREDEHDRRPQEPRRHVPVETTRDRGDRAEDEEPVLQVERDDVHPAHRVERRRVEDRDDGWVRRSRKRREDLRVEAAEEVDRFPLGHPERPRVVGLQALQTRRAKERLEHEAGQGDTRCRDEHGAGGGVSARIAVASRERAVEEHADTARQDDPAEEREHDAPTAESHVEDEELRPQDPEGRDTEEVREAGEAQDVRPARQPSDRPEHRDAQRGIRTVQRGKP